MVSSSGDMVITPEMIQATSERFDEMCQERWEMGAKEYGPVAFLDNDVLTMAMEEVVDLANYARMTFIKLAVLAGKVQDYIAAEVGPQAFIPLGKEDK